MLRLRHLDLSDLRARIYPLVCFIRSQSYSLEFIALRLIELVDGGWSNVLTQLRGSEYPALRRFELQDCMDIELEDYDDSTMLVQDYVARKTDENPWALKLRD